MTREIGAELPKLIEDIGCLCGIPGCKGHEDMGGFILLEGSKPGVQESEDAESELRSNAIGSTTYRNCQ